MSKTQPLDPIALRMARETPCDYAYSKYVLDAWHGGEASARAALSCFVATNRPAPTPKSMGLEPDG